MCSSDLEALGEEELEGEENGGYDDQSVKQALHTNSYVPRRRGARCDLASLYHKYSAV